MKIIGNKLIDGAETLEVVECTGMEVSGHPGAREEFDPENCSVFLTSAHPSRSWFIITTKQREIKGSIVKPFKWLNIREAEEIIGCAVKSDVIDLRELGNYQICGTGETQSVYIMNDLDEWEDRERPILVKVAKD